MLFRSLDGGATWKRLPARGFLGGSLLAPPSPSDTRIFAMGSAGLQVSLDGGLTFIAAAPNSVVIAGSAAISPALFSMMKSTSSRSR